MSLRIHRPSMIDKSKKKKGKYGPLKHSGIPLTGSFHSSKKDDRFLIGFDRSSDQVPPCRLFGAQKWTLAAGFLM
jgi:hypothetical protein